MKGIEMKWIKMKKISVLKNIFENILKNQMLKFCTLFFLASSSSFALDLGSIVNAAAPIVLGNNGQNGQNSANKNNNLQNNPLIGSLQSLGVTPAQAIGGTAVLLNSAKSSMPQNQFLAIGEQTPGITDILGNYAMGSLIGNTSVGSQFKALGMDPALIGQFTPIILNYVKGYANADAFSSLAKALAF